MYYNIGSFNEENMHLISNIEEKDDGMKGKDRSIQKRQFARG